MVGLPANLFFGAGIPAAILLFRKGRENTDVMFVDASREFEAGKKQNRLRAQDIDKIVATVRAAHDVERYARRSTLEEIRENEFNLNISRYVDTYEREDKVDLPAVQQEINDIEAELVGVRAQIARHLRELGL